MLHTPYPPSRPLDITTNGILKLLQTLDTNKAIGPDLIPAFLLKSCVPIFVPILQDTFTHPFSPRTLPDEWLCAIRVSLLFSRLATGLIRVIIISSLSHRLDAVFKHSIHKYIMNHLDTHNTFTDSQHGFRLSDHHHSLCNVDGQDIKKVGALLLNFAKGIDKVPYQNLIVSNFSSTASQDPTFR